MLEPPANDARKLRELSASLASSRISSLRLLVQDTEGAKDLTQSVTRARALNNPQSLRPSAHSGKAMPGPPATSKGVEHDELVVKAEISPENQDEPDLRHSIPVHKTRRSRLDHIIPVNVMTSDQQHMPKKEPPIESLALKKAASDKATTQIKADSADAAKQRAYNLYTTKRSTLGNKPRNSAPNVIRAKPTEMALEPPILPNPTYAGRAHQASYSLTLSGLIKSILLLVFLAATIYLGIGAVSDWCTRRCMSAKQFAHKGDMRPWMKTFNGDIIRDLPKSGLYSPIRHS